MKITTKNVFYATKNAEIQYNVYSMSNGVYHRSFVKALRGIYPQFFPNVDNFVDKMWFRVYKQQVIHSFFHKTVHKSKNCV